MSKKVTVVGSGLVGRCWAIVFARGGFNVTLYDKVASQLTPALGDIRTNLETLQKFNLLFEQSPGEVASRIVIETSLNIALKDAIYVQECVPEQLEIKINVFKELDTVAAPSTILASSTSSIPGSKFTNKLTHRNRCIVSHPINPPHVIPLVEIVPTPWTDKAVVEFTRELMLKVGNAPIVLKKEVLGFVQNRLQYAVLGEAFRLVEDDIVSPADVDTAVVHGLAARWSFMGPFQTIDLNAPNGVSDYCTRYLKGICDVLKEEDNNREFSQQTVDKINAHQRSLYPVTAIPQASKWRDNRLMALATHHRQTKDIDKNLFPQSKL